MRTLGLVVLVPDFFGFLATLALDFWLAWRKEPLVWAMRFFAFFVAFFADADAGIFELLRCALVRERVFLVDFLPRAVRDFDSLLCFDNLTFFAFLAIAVPHQCPAGRDSIR